jgi:hypothetical protein
MPNVEQIQSSREIFDASLAAGRGDNRHLCASFSLPDQK